MRRKNFTREEWFQKFKDLDDPKFRAIQEKLSSLPADTQGRAWVLVTALLNDSVPPHKPQLTSCESFRLFFPRIRISKNTKSATLQKNFNRQKKIHNDLLKVAFSPGVPPSLRIYLLSIIRNYFPFGTLWSFTSKWKSQGRPAKLTRNVCIAGLVELFRQSKFTTEAALDRTSSILKTLGKEVLSFDGIRSAYKSAKKVLKH